MWTMNSYTKKFMEHLPAQQQQKDVWKLLERQD